MDEQTPLPQPDPSLSFEQIMAELRSGEPYQQGLDIARQMLSQIGYHVGELPANAPPEGEVVATLSPRAVHMLKFLHAIDIKTKEAELQDWVSRFYLSKVNDEYVVVVDGYDGDGVDDDIV